MRFNVDLSELWQSVKQISKIKIDIDLEKLTALNPINTTVGLEIPIDEITFTPLPTYQGKQVILFIPDHSYNTLFEETLCDPTKGNKYHLTDCTTLESMRQRNRYKRYFATTNLSGEFTISNGKAKC